MLRKILISMAVLLTAGGATIYLLIEQPERFRPQIETFARDHLGVPVKLGSLAWQWQPQFALTVSKLSVQPDQGPISAITIGQIDFQASIWRLITDGSLLIEGLEINDVVITQKALSSSFDPAPVPDTNAGTDPWQETLQALPDLLLGYFKQLQIERLRATSVRFQTVSNPVPIGDLSFIEVALQDNRLSAELEGSVAIDGYAPVSTWNGSASVAMSVENSPSPTITLSGETNGTVALTGANQTTLKARVTTTWKPAVDQLDLSILAGEFGGVGFSFMGQVAPLARPSIEDIPFDLSVTLKLKDQSALEALMQSAGAQLPITSGAVDLQAKSSVDGIAVKLNSADINDMAWSGDIDFNRIDNQIRGSLKTSVIDLATLLGSNEDSDDDGRAADWDAPLWPETIFAGPDIDIRVAADEISYDGLSLTEVTINGNKDTERASAMLKGTLLGGSIAAETTIQRRLAESHSADWQAQGVDLNNLLQSLTPGQVTSSGRYLFRGVTLSEINESITGASEFKLQNGSLNLAPLKSALVTIDDLLGTASGAKTWPDRLAYDSATGRHRAERGLQQGQSASFDFANIHLKAKGGIDPKTNQASALIDVKVDPSTTPPLKISGPITAVTWPINCEGSLDDDITDLCSPDKSRAKQIAAEIAAAKLKEKGKELLEGLINGEGESALKKLFKW